MWYDRYNLFRHPGVKQRFCNLSGIKGILPFNQHLTFTLPYQNVPLAVPKSSILLS